MDYFDDQSGSSNTSSAAGEMAINNGFYDALLGY